MGFGLRRITIKNLVGRNKKNETRKFSQSQWSSLKILRENNLGALLKEIFLFSEQLSI